MEETTRGNQTNCWSDHKKNDKCIINIFCNDTKANVAHDNNDCHCTINIFCNDMKQENICDCRKNDGHCIINIFCNDNKQDSQYNTENDC